MKFYRLSHRKHREPIRRCKSALRSLFLPSTVRKLRRRSYLYRKVVYSSYKNASNWQILFFAIDDRTKWSRRSNMVRLSLWNETTISKEIEDWKRENVKRINVREMQSCNLIAKCATLVRSLIRILIARRKEIARSNIWRRGFARSSNKDAFIKSCSRSILCSVLSSSLAFVPTPH